MKTQVKIGFLTVLAICITALSAIGFFILEMKELTHSALPGLKPGVCPLRKLRTAGRGAPSNVSNLPILGAISDFSLYDSENKIFSLKDLKGKVVVADFIFTTCSGICLMMTKTMQVLHRSFQDIPDVHFLSVSVNPENDSPAVLADYARRYRASSNKWHFLTGRREIIEDLAVGSFKVGSVAEPVFHSGYFILLDKTSQIRGYYDGSKPADLKKLSGDIAVLVKAKP